MEIQKYISEKVLKCPDCTDSELVEGNATLCCNICHKKYDFHSGSAFFVNYEESPTHDSLDKIKTVFKKYPKLYGFLKNTVSPLYLKDDLGNFLKKYSHENTKAINLGSGNFSVGKGVLNLDLINYDNVEIVSSLESLPFKDNTIDLITINSVLEHVPHSEIVVAEMYRVLKPNGKIFVSVPFICGFHASPYDFNRWTREGVKVLFKDFKTIDLRAEGGPILVKRRIE